MGQYYTPVVIKEKENLILGLDLSERIYNILRSHDDYNFLLKEWEIFTNFGPHVHYLALLGYAEMITGKPVFDTDELGQFAFYGDYHEFEPRFRCQSFEVDEYVEIKPDNIVVFDYLDFALHFPGRNLNIGSMLLTASNERGSGDVLYDYLEPVVPVRLYKVGTVEQEYKVPKLLITGNLPENLIYSEEALADFVLKIRKFVSSGNVADLASFFKAHGVACRFV